MCTHFQLLYIIFSYYQLMQFSQIFTVFDVDCEKVLFGRFFKNHLTDYLRVVLFENISR